MIFLQNIDALNLKTFSLLNPGQDTQEPLKLIEKIEFTKNIS